MSIQALIDHETSALETAEILDSIRKNPALYKRYLAYKKQKELLSLWWKDN